MTNLEPRIGKLLISDEEYLSIDEAEFRARFRERLHHTLEIQVYSSAYRNKKLRSEQTRTTRHLLELWRQRDLPTDLPEYVFATKLLEFAADLSKGKQVDLSDYKPHTVSPQDTESFFKILFERRSVREFTAQDVPDEIIDQILNAGLWAAHSCNLQSIRYLVIREKTTPGLFKGSDIPGGPVHLVVLQDERVYLANPYNPVRNRLLDAGAAAQNLALAAHALGLEGVWLTFNDAMVQRLRSFFKLSENIRIVTYVDVGYGDQTPYPPQRNKVQDVVLHRA